LDLLRPVFLKNIKPVIYNFPKPLSLRLCPSTFNLRDLSLAAVCLFPGPHGSVAWLWHLWIQAGVPITVSGCPGAQAWASGLLRAVRPGHSTTTLFFMTASGPKCASQTAVMSHQVSLGTAGTPGWVGPGHKATHSSQVSDPVELMPALLSLPYLSPFSHPNIPGSPGTQGLWGGMSGSMGCSGASRPESVQSSWLHRPLTS
jgi:hypothetical protein